MQHVAAVLNPTFPKAVPGNVIFRGGCKEHSDQASQSSRWAFLELRIDKDTLLPHLVEWDCKEEPSAEQTPLRVYQLPLGTANVVQVCFAARIRSFLEANASIFSGRHSLAPQLLEFAIDPLLCHIRARLIRHSLHLQLRSRIHPLAESFESCVAMSIDSKHAGNYGPAFSCCGRIC